MRDMHVHVRVHVHVQVQVQVAGWECSAVQCSAVLYGTVGCSTMPRTATALQSYG
jgi:hypothetical protein